MTGRDIPLTSEALRVNIAGTAEQVTIPERYEPLLEAVQGFYGVREPLRDVLTEHFHRLRNVDAVVDGLGTVLLRNWSYFERSDDRARLFELFAELLQQLLALPLSERQMSQLLRLSLTWSAAAIEGSHGAEYAVALDTLAGAMHTRFKTQPVPFLERDRLLRRLTQGARQHHLEGTALPSLLAAVLLFARRRLRDRLDVTRWAASRDAPLKDPAAVRRVFEPVTRVWSGRSDVPGSDEASAPDDAPTFNDLLDRAIEGIYRIDDLEDRFIVCLYFLKDDTLGPRQHDVMVDLLSVVKSLLQPDRAIDFNRLLDLLTRFFHERESLFPEMRFQIYQVVGEAIGEVGAVRAADHLIEDLLSWRFEYPETHGATDEWQTLVNPYHLPAVRCWLRIIASNPLLFERLAAALDVQLRLGGVFIADTDLFQRDVTAFLNADLRPIYFVAKHLLRTLPVYFNEVGAEGELRSVSTEIDEICGRQDTLMHFLRKQVHAESSNRLVAFSRAVLEYWATLDPAGLTPFLSANTLAAVRTEADWAHGPQPC